MSMIYRVISAISFGLASMLIVFVNKIVLTTYSFPSFQILAIGQLVVSIVALSAANYFGILKLSKVTFNYVYNIMPLPIFHFANLLFGLGSTKLLNLPMFSVMRRFSVLMTLLGEQYVLGEKKSIFVQMSIYLMIIGALIASYDDLSFDLNGYICITLNNIFSAAGGIYVKQKLNNTKYSEYDFIYINALFSIVPMMVLCVYTDEYNKLDNFKFWFNIGFWVCFILSSIMAFMLNYVSMLCTKYNSPLTTAVVGCLKNIFVTYFGMLVGGDYIYSPLNFIGLSISAGSSVIYSYLTFKKPGKQQAVSNGDKPKSQ